MPGQPGLKGVVLGQQPTGTVPGNTGRDDQRTVRAGKGRTEDLDGLTVQLSGVGEFVEVVVEGQVDDAIAGVGRGTQAVVIVQIAAMDAGTGRTDRVGRGVGASQADGVVTVGNQITKHRSAHKTRRTRDENLHGVLLMSVTVITLNAMSVTDIP